MSLSFVLAGNNEQNTFYFVRKLLTGAIEEASKLAKHLLVQPFTTPVEDFRVRYDSLADLASFDERTFVHLSTAVVDQFLVDHAISERTLGLLDDFILAKLFHNGNLILEDFIPVCTDEFHFKNTQLLEFSEALLRRVEKFWQVESLSVSTLNSLIKLLEHHRMLVDVKELFICCLGYLDSTLDPLVVKQYCQKSVIDLFQFLIENHIFSEADHPKELERILLSHEDVEVIYVKHLASIIRAIERKCLATSALVPPEWCVPLNDSQISSVLGSLRENYSEELHQWFDDMVKYINDTGSLRNFVRPTESMLKVVHYYMPNIFPVSPDIKFENFNHVFELFNQIRMSLY